MLNTILNFKKSLNNIAEIDVSQSVKKKCLWGSEFFQYEIEINPTKVYDCANKIKKYLLAHLPRNKYIHINSIYINLSETTEQYPTLLYINVLEENTIEKKFEKKNLQHMYSWKPTMC